MHDQEQSCLKPSSMRILLISNRYVMPNYMMFNIAEALVSQPQELIALCSPVPPLVRIHAPDLCRMIVDAKLNVGNTLKKHPHQSHIQFDLLLFFLSPAITVSRDWYSHTSCCEEACCLVTQPLPSTSDPSQQGTCHQLCNSKRYLNAIRGDCTWLTVCEQIHPRGPRAIFPNSRPLCPLASPK